MIENFTTTTLDLPFNQVMVENFSHFLSYNYYPPIKQPVYMIVLLSLVYGLVFIVALIGNMMVIAVVYKNPGMRNTTNYFIVNLAIADILVAIICIPLTLLDNIYSGQAVAFYAYVDQPMHNPAYRQTIRFNHLVTNVGHNYDNTTGIFTCTQAGTYVFSWTIKGAPLVVTTILMRNGSPVGYEGSQDAKFDNTGSSGAILELNAGDTVSIILAGSGVEYIDTVFTNFRGFLIK